MAKPGEKLKKGLFAAHRPGKYLQAQADQREADRNRADAERFRQEAVDMVGRLNYEPRYVSDIMPAFKKAESPVARAFLESLLTGANPSSVASTRHGADRLKAGAQAGFDQQTGGWEQLLARQREVERETPWMPGTYGGAPAVMPLGGVYAGPRVASAPSGGAPGWGDVGQGMSGDELTRLRDQRIRRMTGA